MSESHSTWQEDWSWSVDDPFNFEVTRSKVKVTVAFNAKTMSAKYLEKFPSDSHGTWQEDLSYSVDDPYTFQVKGQGHSSIYAKTELNILKSL